MARSPQLRCTQRRRGLPRGCARVCQVHSGTFTHGVVDLEVRPAVVPHFKAFRAAPLHAKRVFQDFRHVGRCIQDFIALTQLIRRCGAIGIVRLNRSFVRRPRCSRWSTVVGRISRVSFYEIGSYRADDHRAVLRNYCVDPFTKLPPGATSLGADEFDSCCVPPRPLSRQSAPLRKSRGVFLFPAVPDASIRRCIGSSNRRIEPRGDGKGRKGRAGVEGG